MSLKPQESTVKVLTAPRLTTLISSVVVALASGTNYVYSAYAPQLGTRLRISHTKLNIIGLAGNIGVYGSGPIMGKMVDRRGPRILLASAFLFLLVGYSGIRYFYDHPDTKAEPSTGGERISHSALALLVACSFLTGAGGNGGLTSSVNATAKSFPDEMRASTTAVVLSGFGLSAFFFSTIAHVLYPGDTSSFLELLAMGTALPMVMGFFLVRPLPMESSSNTAPISHSRRMSVSDIPHDGFAHSAGVDDVFRGDALVYEHHNDSRTTLLRTASPAGPAHRSPAPFRSESEYIHEDHGEMRTPPLPSVELTGSPILGRRRRSISAIGHGRNQSRIIEVMQEVHGPALLGSRDFWLLSVMLTLLSGTGIMYINNVGSISQALFAQGNPDFDVIESAKWQSMQVSIISVANCGGRILSGISADLVKNRLALPRTYVLCGVALIFVLSQVLVTQIDAVESLWVASATLGLAYGGLFGIYPTLVIEWFGLTHFSENWGYVSLWPMVGGNLFSLAFGRNLDAHNPPAEDADSAATLVTRGLPAGEQCFAGKSCYVDSLYLTIFACMLGFGLSVYAALKDRRRMKIVNPEEYQEIIWEEEDEV